MKDRRGFTFFEVMLTVVILAIGITGIYRAFLISLHYQQYLLTRLHIVNCLTTQFALLENNILSGGNPSFQKEVPQSEIPTDARSKIILQAGVDSLSATKATASRLLTVRLQWNQQKKSQLFERSSFVYVGN